MGSRLKIAEYGSWRRRLAMRMHGLLEHARAGFPASSFSATIALVASLMAIPAAHAAYVQATVTQTAFQTAPTAWAPGDDSQLQVAIGFTFNFNGTDYTNVWLNSNGTLSFTAGTTAYSNTALPSTSVPADTIMPYWDDLYAPTFGNVTYGMVGTAPNRQFIASWNTVSHYSDRTQRCSFQAVLGEDQSIRFRYRTTNVNCNGSASATTGLQENASSYYQISNGTAIDLTKDVLFTRVPTLSVQKTVSLLCDPLNGASNPKNIPGAVSRWTITVTNTSRASATLTQIADTLASNVSFDSNFVLGATAATCLSNAPGVPTSAAGRGFLASVSGTTRTGFPKYLTSAADADGATFSSPSAISIDFANLLPVQTGYSAGQLKFNESVTIQFNVVLN